MPLLRLIVGVRERVNRTLGRHLGIVLFGLVVSVNL